MSKNGMVATAAATLQKFQNGARWFTLSCTTGRCPGQSGQITLLALALLVTLVGCRPSWQVLLLGPDGNPVMVDRQVLASLDDFEEVDGQRRVNLERVLLGGGHQVVERAGYVHPGFCGVKVTGE